MTTEELPPTANFVPSANTELAESALRRADALVAVNRRLGGKRTGTARDGGPDQRSLADLLLRMAGNIDVAKMAVLAAAILSSDFIKPSLGAKD